MSTSTIIILAVIAIVIISLISISNGITERKNQSKRSWADVLTYLRFKLKLLPKLEEALAAYVSHEDGVFEKITKLRSAMESIAIDSNVDTATVKRIESKLKEVMAAIKVTVENYPTLKADGLYGDFMNEISEAETNIAASITIFNESVASFNNSIQTFPGNVINTLFNKQSVITEFSDEEASSEVTYSPNL